MAASRAWRKGLRTFIALEQPITQELIGAHPIIQVGTLPACIQLDRAQSGACGAPPVQSQYLAGAAFELGSSFQLG